MSEFGAGVQQENNMLSEMRGRSQALLSHLDDEKDFYQSQLQEGVKERQEEEDPKQLGFDATQIVQVGKRLSDARGVLSDVYKNDKLDYMKGLGRTGEETDFGIRAGINRGRQLGRLAQRTATSVGEGVSSLAESASEALPSLDDVSSSVSETLTQLKTGALSGANRVLGMGQPAEFDPEAAAKWVPRFNLTGDEIDDPEGAVKKLTPNFNAENARQGVIKRQIARGERPPLTAEEQGNFDTLLGQAKQADTLHQGEVLKNIKSEIALREQGVARPSSFDATTGEVAPEYDLNQIPDESNLIPDDLPAPPRPGFAGRKPPQPPSEPPPSQETTDEGQPGSEGAASSGEATAVEGAAGEATEDIKPVSMLQKMGSKVGGLAETGAELGAKAGAVFGAVSAGESFAEDMAGGHFHLAGDNNAEKTGNALSMASGALDTIGLAVPPLAIVGGILGVGSAISDLVGHLEDAHKKTSVAAQQLVKKPSPFTIGAAATSIGQVASQATDTLHSISGSF